VGAIEESEEDEVRAMVDTNFFGLARMIRAVLPEMRKRRRGFIVNISSNGGLQAFPGFGYYNSTKFAVEGLSEALEKEVAPLGIKVLLVEPGPFRTDWAGRSLKRTKERIPEYAETAGAPLERLISGSGKQVGDPVRAGEIIIKAVESENMPLHLVLGKVAVETARSKIELLRRDVDAWEEIALSADYPEHQTVVK
jgi:NAD(P)-dependent dehydrogenase (short-subunit alcohol dehydrogenase family)